MILFLDTEFTGLGQRWPRLISIGLVSEDGQHEFYAELNVESYIEHCSQWVKENVLPFLGGGDCVMRTDELRQRLAAWISTLGTVQIAIDSQIDFDLIRATLDPWPTNVAQKPQFLLFDADTGERFNTALENAFTKGLRRHHALDDAKANRLGWLMSQTP
jgi:hypothetical protein